jgi:MSHA biogenesis protein MshM
MGPLPRRGLDDYLAHRLRVAGHCGDNVFARGAVSKLYASSGGIPRLVNILAHKSLMLAYGEGARQVAKRHVRLAAADTLAIKQSFMRRKWPWLAGFGLLVAASGLTWAFTV